MTAPARLARVHEAAAALAAGVYEAAAALAAEVRAIAEEQTLAEHIRDQAASTGLEMDARRLCAGIAAMVERERGRAPDLFEGAAA